MSSVDSPSHDLDSWIFDASVVFLFLLFITPSFSSIILTITIWSEVSNGATDMSLTALNFPQLLRCSFSKRKKFQTNRLKQSIVQIHSNNVYTFFVENFDTNVYGTNNEFKCHCVWVFFNISAILAFSLKNFSITFICLVGRNNAVLQKLIDQQIVITHLCCMSWLQKLQQLSNINFVYSKLVKNTWTSLSYKECISPIIHSFLTDHTSIILDQKFWRSTQAPYNFLLFSCSAYQCMK